MRVRLAFFLIAIYPFLTGASLIDQETKRTVINLNRRVESLLEKQKLDKAEQQRIVEAIQDIQKLQIGQQKLLEGILGLKRSDGSEPLASLQRASRWGLFFSVVSLFGLFLFFFAFRADRRRIGEIVRAINTLQAERVAAEEELEEKTPRGPFRPRLTVNPDKKKLEIVNLGKNPAAEISLSLGPAPTTLAQRHRVVGQLQTGEKTIFELDRWIDEKLYGSIEYKNPKTGRVYKDHFVLDYDPLDERFFSHA